MIKEFIKRVWLEICIPTVIMLMAILIAIGTANIIIELIFK